MLKLLCIAEFSKVLEARSLQLLDRVTRRLEFPRSVPGSLHVGSCTTRLLQLLCTEAYDA